MGAGAVTKAAANGLSCAVEEAYSEETVKKHGKATQQKKPEGWILESAFAAAGEGVGGACIHLGGQLRGGTRGGGSGTLGPKSGGGRGRPEFGHSRPPRAQLWTNIGAIDAM